MSDTTTELTGTSDVPETMEGIESKPTVKVTKKSKRAKPVVLAKNRGIGKYAVLLMTTTEKSNNQILADVKKKFAGCKTTYECIAWYRSKIRREACESGT